MRSAGVNNIGLSTKAKYLVLWNADVVRKDGMWHYLLDFDVRNSLEKSEIAQLMAGEGEAAAYEGKTDWKAFLGDDFDVVSSARRGQIAREGSTTGEAASVVKISCMRVGASNFALPMSA